MASTFTRSSTSSPSVGSRYFIPNSLRRIVALSAEAGLPTPALAAALGHFDGFRRARGTADLIQAQRDYFGAHGFERIDREGAHHGPWKTQ